MQIVATVPDDVFHVIISFLSPIDILRLRQTCTYFSRLTRHRQAWFNIVHRRLDNEYISRGASYDIGSMSTADLETAATMPYRIMHPRRIPPQCDSNPSPDNAKHVAEHLELSRLLPTLTGAFIPTNSTSMNFLPGGRYLAVTFPSVPQWGFDLIRLFDLGGGIDFQPKIYASLCLMKMIPGTPVAINMLDLTPVYDTDAGTKNVAIVLFESTAKRSPGSIISLREIEVEPRNPDPEYFIPDGEGQTREFKPTKELSCPLGIGPRCTTFGTLLACHYSVDQVDVIIIWDHGQNRAQAWSFDIPCDPNERNYELHLEANYVFLINEERLVLGWEILEGSWYPASSTKPLDHRTTRQPSFTFEPVPPGPPGRFHRIDTPLIKRSQFDPGYTRIFYTYESQTGLAQAFQCYALKFDPKPSIALVRHAEREVTSTHDLAYLLDAQEHDLLIWKPVDDSQSNDGAKMVRVLALDMKPGAPEVPYEEDDSKWAVVDFGKPSNGRKLHPRRMEYSTFFLSPFTGRVGIVDPVRRAWAGQLCAYTETENLFEVEEEFREEEDGEEWDDDDVE